MKLNISVEKIKEIIGTILDELELSIYEVNITNEYESNVIQILVEQNDGNPIVPFDSLISANEKIGERLDEIDSLNEKYILEVSSAGIEKTIKSKNELIKSINKYLYLESKEHKINTNVTLLEYDENNDMFLFGYLLKGQKKKLHCKYEEINFIRFAVKF